MGTVTNLELNSDLGIPSVVPLDFIMYATSQHQELSDLPWMMPYTTSFLSLLLNPTMRILEFGAGGSTIFFAKKCAHVHSIETDQFWHDKVQERLNELQLSSKVTLEYFPILAEGKWPGDLDHRLAKEYDLIFCDGVGSGRNEFMMRTWFLVAGGGWIVLDNSNQPAYRQAVEQIRSRAWPEFTMPAVSPGEALQTSFWRRTYLAEKRTHRVEDTLISKQGEWT